MALVLTGLLFLPGVPAAAQEAGHAVYRSPLLQDPVTLDPARVGDIYGRAVAQQLFDGLVQYDRTLTVAPAIAEFWKASRDGLVWTFTLRKGVKFHHGREVTADDVVYSLTRVLDPKFRSEVADSFTAIKGAHEFRSGRAPSVSGLSAPRRYTVKVVLTEPRAPFVAELAVGHAKIVPREVVEQRGESFGRQPVGTGPFRFVRWERGKEIVLAANREYFGGRPHIREVVFRVFEGADFGAIHDQFVKGNLHDEPVPTALYAKAIADPDFIYVKRPMLSVRFYGLNVRTKPLDDPRVRRALIHAIDHRAIIQEIYRGRYIPAQGILPPGSLGYNAGLTGFAYDPDRARALLSAAGYPRGKGLPVIHMWASAGRELTLREHAAVKRYLDAVNIPVEFHYAPDWPTFSRMLREGQMPAFLYAWYADVPDPDTFLTRLFFSRSPNNFTGYRNAAVDELLTRARSEQDITRRVELYRQAEQQVLNDAPIIPFWHYTYERLFQRNVKGIEVNGLGDSYILLRMIRLDVPAGAGR